MPQLTDRTALLNLLFCREAPVCRTSDGECLMVVGSGLAALRVISEKPVTEWGPNASVFCIAGPHGFPMSFVDAKPLDFASLGKAIFRSWSDELSLRPTDSGESLCCPF